MFSASFASLLLSFRSRAALQLEILALRHQLGVLHRGHRLGRLLLADVATIVTPDTILRWHRELVARNWTYSGGRSRRSGLQTRIRSLVVRLATENPTWGYTRIQGAMKNVGHQVGRSTIARILKAAGLPPSRERPMPWRTFMRAHWPALLAADFFTTEVWTLRGLMTYYTAFVIELHSRRVYVLGSKRLRRAIRPVGEGGMPESRCSARRTALASDAS